MLEASTFSRCECINQNFTPPQNPPLLLFTFISNSWTLICFLPPSFPHPLSTHIPLSSFTFHPFSLVIWHSVFLSSVGFVTYSTHLTIKPPSCVTIYHLLAWLCRTPPLLQPYSLYYIQSQERSWPITLFTHSLHRYCLFCRVSPAICVLNWKWENNIALYFWV